MRERESPTWYGAKDNQFLYDACRYVCSDLVKRTVYMTLLLTGMMTQAVQELANPYLYALFIVIIANAFQYA